MTHDKKKWRRRIYLLLSTLLVMIVGFALQAGAQTQNCAPRDMVIERLANKYGEVRQSMGLGANNVVIEVFASEKSGTWTITATSVSGLTCLVASGQAYENVSETLKSEGAPL